MIPKKNMLSVLALILFAFLLFRPGAILSQSYHKKAVASIIFVGNKYTKSEVLKRELLFKKGDLLNDSLLEASRKRLENLWLFNRVEFFTLPRRDSVSILISVTERLFIYPYPILQIDDRDWKKVTYGFGFAHLNFRGWNEKLYLNVLFGNRSGFELSYFNPWIAGKHHLTAGVYFNKFSLNNRSFGFEEKHFYSALSVGKYWTRFLASQLLVYRDQIHVAQPFTRFLNSETATDINNGLRLVNVFDNRDLYAYPSKGWYINLSLRKSGLFDKHINYFQYALDVRKYLHLNKLILASRIYTKQSLGRLPVYDRVYLGFQNRIRGHFYEFHEGKHLFFSGLGLRFPLIKVHYFDVPSVLLPKSTTQNLKFGLNGGFFIESGMVWSKRADFQPKNFISGFGASLHFLLPYVEVFRIDLAFNEQLQSQLIAEVAMPF